MSSDSPVSVQDLVISIIAEHLEIDKDTIKPESHIENDLGGDSLDKTELAMEFEEEFDMDIPDAEAEKIHTVQDAVNCIEKLLAQKQKE